MNRTQTHAALVTLAGKLDRQAQAQQVDADHYARLRRARPYDDRAASWAAQERLAIAAATLHGDDATSVRAALDWLAVLEGANEEARALANFKAYVHGRLDAAGVPTHPAGPHSAAGCRVGDRLDLALAPFIAGGA